MRLDGDDLVTDTLRPLVNAIVEESVTLAATLPDEVRTDAAAIDGGADAAATWSRLSHLYGQWCEAHSIADELRSTGALPSADTRPIAFVDTDAHRFGAIVAAVNATDDDVVRNARILQGIGRFPVARRLSVLHEVGAKPGIYTADDVLVRGSVTV